MKTEICDTTGATLPVVWQATPELRYLHRFETIGGITYDRGKRLQQYWQCSDGRTEWRDVPVDVFECA